MQADTNVDGNIYEKLLEQENVDFFKALESKEKCTDEEVRNIIDKKKEVFNKIAENKAKVEKDPKVLRDYISNSESVLESADRIFNNLTELLNLYRDIENGLVIVSEKYELNPRSNGLEDDVNSLIDKIKNAKYLEQRNRTDNERNYIIIKEFLNKPLDVNLQVEVEKTPCSKESDDGVKFDDLNMDNITDHMVLKICEKRVELPYTKKEVEEFMKAYPEDYKTVQDVISKEFMVHISIFNKHPVLSRFREAYYLCRAKEMLSVFDSFNFANSIMFRSDINSSVIAAVKSKKQLEEYIDCLEHNNLDNFKYFKIIFEINPLSTSF